MTQKPVHISDHALIRYLERVAGVSLEIVRAEMRDLVRDAIDAGATRAVVDGYSYEMDPRSRTVITVYPKGRTLHRHHGYANSLRVRISDMRGAK